MIGRPGSKGGIALTLITALLGCGGEEADIAAPEGGGNVGFGGAQDIGQFRDLLERGEIPGESTLDANGFFSEHYAELPPPDCGDELCLHAMFAVSRDWVHWDHQAALQLAFNTPMTPADIGEMPRDLVVVVDTSGSMASDGRLDKVKAGLHILIDELGETDRLGLVRYSDSASVVAELGPVGSGLHELVDGLSDGGATNISAGLDLGFQTLGPDPEGEERQRRVILLSDGLANRGVTSDEAIFSLADGWIEGGRGLTTIGVGADFNTELMRGLAERGAGNFYFLEDAAAIDEVFREELDFFTVPIAFDIEIRVDATSDYAIGETIGTPLASNDAGASVIEVPSVFLASRTSDEPGESGRRGGGSAVFVALVPRTDRVGPSVAASISLTYRTPDGETIERSLLVENPYAPGVIPEDDYYSKEFMREHYGMYNMYLGLREATRAAETDYRCAATVLSELRDNATEWNLVMEDADIAADLELVDLFLSNLAARGAYPEVDKSTDVCSGGYPDPGYPPGYDEDYGDNYYGCNAGSGGGGSLAALLLLGIAATFRRRRWASRSPAWGGVSSRSRCGKGSE